MKEQKDYTEENLAFLRKCQNPERQSTLGEALTGERLQIEPPKPKKSYPQDWWAYNTAQCNEKPLFFHFLEQALATIQFPYLYKGNGRPQLQIPDIIKACATKVFTTQSLRRASSDITIAKQGGYLEKAPHFNTISSYMNSPELTPYLQQIYKIIASPLSTVEDTFAPDATGFSTVRYKGWIHNKYKKIKDFKKLHIMCGVKTNIITSAIITEGNEADIKYLKQLLKETAEYFQVKQVCADSGYLSRENTKAIAEVGAKPYIKPKKNTIRKPLGCTAWARMIDEWQTDPESFKKNYSPRSNVESTFSAIKAKQLATLRSKNFTSQQNELLLKIICHNIGVLIHQIFKRNINPTFCDKPPL